jgi:hypothetical protein
MPQAAFAREWSEAYRINHCHNKANEPFKLDVFDFKEDRLPFLVRKGIENGDISMSRGAEILRLRHVDMRALSASWVS